MDALVSCTFIGLVLGIPFIRAELQLRRSRATIERLNFELGEARKEFVHLAEYWNGGHGGAAVEACEHTAEEAALWADRLQWFLDDAMKEE